MSNNIAVLLSAKDNTLAAFASVSRSLAGLQAGTARVSSLLSSLGIVSGVSAAGVAAMVKSSIDLADSFNDMSDRTGVAIKDLASLKTAADLSDTSIDAVAKAMQRMTLSVGQAQSGSKEIAEALGRLNITSTDARERLFQLADAYAKAGDKTKVIADLNRILGKSYSEMLPLLARGGDDLRRITQESESFAQTMARLAPDAGEFNDNLDKLKVSAAGAAGAIAVDLVPAINRLSFEFSEGIKQAGGFWEAVRLYGFGLSPFDEAGESLEKLGARFRVIDQQIKRAKERDDQTTIKRLESEREDVLKKIKYLNALQAANKPQPKPLAAPQNVREFVADLPPIVVTPKLAKWEEVFTKAEFDKAQRALAASGKLSFSFITNDKEVAEFIRNQFDAVNALQGEIATTLEMYDALASGSYLTSDRSAADFIREQQAAINALNSDIANSIALEEARADKLVETKSIAEELGLTFTSAFEDAIVAGDSFGDVLKAIEADLIRLLVRMSVTDPLMSGIKSAMGDFNIGSFVAGLFGSANGNVFTNAPALSAYSGSVVNSPTVFPFASGGVPNLGLMGEAGPEAILPLKRGPGGNLGVEAAGNVSVVVNNQVAPATATVTERMDGGNRIIEVLLERVDSMVAGGVTKGGSATSAAIERTYGLSRTPGAY